MDLSLSDEQKQLQESADRFVRDKYTFENRRKIVATERGWLPENWAQFAELGWLGMSFSEEDGGYGGGPIETMIVMEQFGKGLVLEPFLPTVVLGGGMIARAGSKAQKEALLAPMIEGKKQFAFAWLERQSRYNLADVSLKATKEGVYYGQCSELCGINHAYMPIEIHAVSREEFDAWIAQQGGAFASAEPAATTPAATGTTTATPPATEQPAAAPSTTTR